MAEIKISRLDTSLRRLRHVAEGERNALPGPLYEQRQGGRKAGVGAAQGV